MSSSRESFCRVDLAHPGDLECTSFYMQCRLWAVLKTASGGTGLVFVDWLKKCSSLKRAYHEVVHVVSWMLGAGACTESRTRLSRAPRAVTATPESSPSPSSLSPCRLFFRGHWLIVPWVEQRRCSHRVTAFLKRAQSSLELPPLKEDGACCLWTELFAQQRPDEDAARVN